MQMIDAVYDGSVLQPLGTLRFEPGARVRLIVQAIPEGVPLPPDPPRQGTAAPYSFFDAVLSLRVDDTLPDRPTIVDGYPHADTVHPPR